MTPPKADRENTAGHPLDFSPVPLSPAQRAQFERYLDLLLTWNRRVNLTAITEPRDIYIKHFLDALVLVPLIEMRLTPQRLIDVGSGAGFPGAPLAIARPTWQVVLLEATRKKVRFLEVLVAELGLRNVSVCWGRAEEVAHDPAHREQYDVAVARALAPLPTLLELSLPFVRPGGYLLAPKGPNPHAEVAAAGRALDVLGGTIQEIVPVQVPLLEEPRTVIVVHKQHQTPAVYPRPPGRPAKRPL